MSTGAKVGIGLAASAAAAAAGVASYYFYAHKNAAKNRRIVAKWANDLKDDVVSRARKLKKLDRQAIVALVDQAVATYETVRDIDRSDLERAAKELKDNWQKIISELPQAARSSIREVKSKATTHRARRKNS